ncbi:hypothetical protein [Desulfonema magnum]|uniref:Amidohydrolase n=1 Tax=Desulfonema magnum TaxID=45655 RepID=A0A975BLE4_9BACT|nr:hypothetical protein [Desulfonema magnum]QTA87661.1 Uncharacterized protein dnm_036950 [Desulfonema magnum]
MNQSQITKMNLPIIDAHAHCGIQDRYPDQSSEAYLSYAGNTGISGVVMFSPVTEIYDRYDLKSDFPFGTPRYEIEKILKFKIPQETKQAVISLNVKHMLAENVC